LNSKQSSLSAIANLLGGEGFSEYAANEVRRYWFARHVTREGKRRLGKVKKAFGEMVAEKLDERDQLVLGKFISVLCKAQFDTGLRLGLMTLAATNGNGPATCCTTFNLETAGEPVAHGERSE
jgi:hypothetical protein